MEAAIGLNLAFWGRYCFKPAALPQAIRLRMAGAVKGSAIGCHFKASAEMRWGNHDLQAG
jgi:hypothetical protein